MAKSLKLREQVVENICSEGCKFVNQLLSSTHLQSEHKELQQLIEVDQDWILAELRSIMSVYGNSGSCTL